MIDIQGERMMTIGRARDWLTSRLGHEFSRMTIYRWAKIGSKGRVLETVQVGGSLFTSEEALLRFIEAGDSDDGSISPAAQSRLDDLATRRAARIFG